MNIKFNFIGFLTIAAAIGLFVSTNPAQAASSASLSNSDESVVVSSVSNGPETAAIVPPGGISNGPETDPIVPSGGLSNGPETDNLVPNGGISNDANDTSSPSNPPGGDNNGGGTGGNPGGTTGGSPTGGSSGTGGSSSGGTPILSSTGGVGGGSSGSSSSLTSSCPLITDYLKLGGTNNPAQVLKLQIFLRNNEHMDVDANGIFDAKTDAAVNAFQKKYLSDILGPWDATRSTGFVYITTTKKINQLACANPIVFTAAERAIIEAYKNRADVDATATEPGFGPLNPGNPSVTLNSSTTDANNTATVGNASILQRFWKFILDLFR